MDKYQDIKKIDSLLKFAAHAGATKVQRLSPESVRGRDPGHFLPRTEMGLSIS